MRELTFEVDDFGKPLLHNKMNSVIMQIYSILLNSENKAYPNQAIGVGFIDYVGTVASDSEIRNISEDLIKVISSLITGVIVSDVNINVVRDDENSVSTTLKITISFTYMDTDGLAEGEATYSFGIVNGEIKSHIFV